MVVKNKDLYYLKTIMSFVNFAILLYFSVVSIYTTYFISHKYIARNFIENISYIPMEPKKASVWMFIAFFSLLCVIEIRNDNKKNHLSVILYMAEILLCVIIMGCLYFSYNGIVLLVIADIVTSIRNRNRRTIFLSIMAA